MGKIIRLDSKAKPATGWQLRLPFIAFIGVGAATYFASEGLPAMTLPNALNPACNIKGNVSLNTGERIYHVPDQEYYGRTWIDQRAGERWFCSESEARAAGWRKAKV